MTDHMLPGDPLESDFTPDLEHAQLPHEIESERLLSRVVDGEATAGEWSAFCRAADTTPGLWRELAEMQHQHSELSTHVMHAIAIADSVETPVQEEMVYRFQERLRTAVVIGGWTGWAAAAAAILVAWGVGLPGFGKGAASGNGDVVHAGIPGAGWADAFQTYLDRGRENGTVVGELPERILINARELPATGADAGMRYEVFYVRQIMERAVVKDLYGVGTDDAGRPTPVRIQVAPAAAPRPM